VAGRAGAGPAARPAPADRTRFTTIAHRDLLLCNPVSSEKVDRVLGLIELPPGARVLDVGCAKAEMLIRLIERHGCAAIGVDTNAAFLAEARARAFDRGVAGQLELREQGAATLDEPAGSFDAALCVGATHACDGTAKTLAALRRLVRPGGHVLVGEGFWRRKPAPAYLEAIGAKPADLADHAGNVAAGLAAELVFLYAAVSGEDDFDHYEGLYHRAVESHCLEHPEDPDAPAMRKRIRAWHEAYLRWGRDTMGFALYLFRVA